MRVWPFAWWAPWKKAVNAIQVDMFAVGLGAAVLTQFVVDDDQIVAVLSEFDSFRTGRPGRIDLIVGTHYDGDHLKGLLPIVQNSSIEIGEPCGPVERRLADITASLAG